MARLLLILAIAAVGWYLYRRLKAGGPPATPGQPPAGQKQPAMLRCAECGVHAPEGSGVRYQSQFFCSPDHLAEYLRKHGQQ